MYEFYTKSYKDFRGRGGEFFRIFWKKFEVFFGPKWKINAKITFV